MAVNSTIIQFISGAPIPVGMPLIFTVENRPAVADETKVKFCAEIHIGSNQPNTANSNNLVGVFKTTPNNAGVGMFDVRNVVENYVKADNLASDGSAYKTTTTSALNRHPLHLIDKFSLSDNISRWLVIQFYVEYLDTDPTSPDYNTVRKFGGTVQNSRMYLISNGYIKHTDNLEETSGARGYYYDMGKFAMASSTIGSFLSNAPTNQFANVNDYGTIAFTMNPTPLTGVYRAKFEFYDSSNVLLSQDAIIFGDATGGFESYSVDSKKQIIYLGCFPANLKGWSTFFNGIASQIEGGYITVEIQNSSSVALSQKYTINVNCPNTKGYESIRLCWLNQWGAWDYYTFTKKSSKSISTQGSTYQQLGGTWNERKYRVDGYKGGTRSFRVNATEKISMNTGFVSEDDNVMFEELINSPEVYQLEGFQTDVSNAALNQYVTPVRLTTSSFTRKTVANDRLMQYTFEIEKSKTLRTQSI